MAGQESRRSLADTDEATRERAEGHRDPLSTDVQAVEGHEAEHTPGPWIICPPDGGGSSFDELWIRISPSEGVVCAVWPWGENDNGGYDTPERAANARLIAAAPDLLAALEGLVLEHDTQAAEDRRDAGMARPWIGPCSCGSCDEARAAIAKARGL